MPRYTFECPKCKCRFDYIVTIAKRDDPLGCPECSTVCKREIGAPALTYGSIDNYPDNYWENSERIKQKDIKKRYEDEAEKAFSNDKEEVKKIENQIVNAERLGVTKIAEVAEQRLKKDI